MASLLNGLFGAAIVLVVPAVIGGCSSDKKATARVTFDSDIQAGSHTVSKDPETACMDDGPFLAIGSFGNPGAGKNPDGSPVDPVTPVDDGTGFGQGTASVTCSVTAEGDGFHVSATAALGGAKGGEFYIDGHFTAMGDQGNINASFSSQGRGNYIADGKSGSTLCTARYDQPLMAVAAGRVWADIDCPDASDRGGSQRICHLSAQFRFENCNQ